MFGSSKLRLDPALLRKCREYAAAAEYPSVEEFIAHALEQEFAELEGADSEEEIRKKLQGLGYIS